MLGCRLLESRSWNRRAVAWVGGLFIAAIVALAAYDIVTSCQAAVHTTGRELEAAAASGEPRASSLRYPLPETVVNVSGLAFFQALRQPITRSEAAGRRGSRRRRAPTGRDGDAV